LLLLRSIQLIRWHFSIIHTSTKTQTYTHG
jgi:hypothetical protein